MLKQNTQVNGCLDVYAKEKTYIYLLAIPEPKPVKTRQTMKAIKDFGNTIIKDAIMFKHMPENEIFLLPYLSDR